jgi:4,4'-diaponeurosporenoate glycosyltransferase
MFFLALLSIGGLGAGLLLLRTVPVIDARSEATANQLRVSVIIPARNEETNLPPLLESLRQSASCPFEVLVVDDDSTDNTAAVAIRYGARVITAAPLPRGWTGKTWACHQGALTAVGDVFFFLDADTRFVDGGFARIASHFSTLADDTALSILPFHRMQCWYEQLSLFFNILVGMGAGGFSKLDSPHLFGQSLLVRRGIYFKAGGHESVKGEITENLHFAANLLAASGTICTLGGRGSLEMRMFPNGLAQLRESWQKAFVKAAGVTSPLVITLSVYWLAGAMLSACMLFAIQSPLWPAFTTLYLLNAIQIAWFGSQLGTFRWLTALGYPVALTFYFAIFAQSMRRRNGGQSVTWRGRQI